LTCDRNQLNQRSVTHDSLRYINILTYLLTYLLNLTYDDVRSMLMVYFVLLCAYQPLFLVFIRTAISPPL